MSTSREFIVAQKKKTEILLDKESKEWKTN